MYVCICIYSSYVFFPFLGTSRWYRKRMYMFDLIDPRYNDKSINVLKDVFVGRSKLSNNLSTKIRLRGVYIFDERTYVDTKRSYLS